MLFFCDSTSLEIGEPMNPIFLGYSFNANPCIFSCEMLKTILRIRIRMVRESIPQIQAQFTISLILI